MASKLKTTNQTMFNMMNEFYIRAINEKKTNSKGFLKAKDIPHAEKVLEDTIKVISDIRLREKKRDLEEKLSNMNEDF